MGQGTASVTVFGDANNQESKDSTVLYNRTLRAETQAQRRTESVCTGALKKHLLWSWTYIQNELLRWDLVDIFKSILQQFLCWDWNKTQNNVLFQNIFYPLKWRRCTERTMTLLSLVTHSSAFVKSTTTTTTYEHLYISIYGHFYYTRYLHNERP